MKELLIKMIDTRWGSTKFWLTVLACAALILLLWNGKLGEDNFMILYGGNIGAYLGINLLQHKTYANGKDS